MTKTLKYIGTQNRWPELAYTGKPSAWARGAIDQRSDSDAAKLLPTGLFVDLDAQAQTVDETAGLPALVSPSGAGPASQAFSRGLLGAQRPHLGVRIPAGTLSVLDTTSNATYFDCTHQCTLRLARKAYAVRLIFAGYAASATANIKAAVSAASGVSGTTANNSSGTWVGVTFSGAATGTIPARTSATRPSLYFSDWTEIDVSSKILVTRVYVPAAGNTGFTMAAFNNVTGDGAGAAAAAALWATETGDEWVNRKQQTDGVATPTGFTSTTFYGFAGVLGVQYLTTEGVVTIGAVGDSITQGTYTTLANNAHWAQAVRALKVAGYGVEAANLGWSGQETSVYYLRALDAAQYLGIQHLIYSVWSPNDGNDNPTQAHVAAMRARWARVMLQADQYRVNVIPMTGIPKTTSSNTASAWSDAEDDLRRTLNAEVRACPLYIDPDIVVGNRNTAGLAAATFVDNSYPASGSEVHLSQAGNAACMPSMLSVLEGLAPVVRTA